MTDKTRVVIATEYKHLEAELLNTLDEFDQFGSLIQKSRNTIRRGTFANLDITIKSFKTPNCLQGWIYGVFRPSKAKRSFLYAKVLTEKDIGTAQPIAYVEHYKGNLLKKSFFVSHYVDHDFTIREVINDKTPDKTRIMKEFIAFTLKLHDSEVLHLDHSQGNTLIKKTNGGYQFSIIDINRMMFKPLNLKTRLNNFIRLSEKESDLASFATLYAECVNQDPNFCVQYMLEQSNKRQRNVKMKKQFKRLIKK